MVNILLLNYLYKLISMKEFEQNSPRFYINPVTGRLIKSSGKIYNELKQIQKEETKFSIEKHKCLYNVKSAERCLTKILKLYPNVVYPPSSFIEIPKTFRHKNIRAFIQDKKTNAFIGYIDKTGSKFKLYKPIKYDNNNNIPVVYDNYNVLSNIVDKIDPISFDEQLHLEKDLIIQKREKEYNNNNNQKDVILLFNPLKNDFIPINTTMDTVELENILKIFNRELLPQQLPPINHNSNSSLSGFVKDETYIYGIVDTNNSIKRFKNPIDLQQLQNQIQKVEKKIKSIDKKVSNIEHVITNFSDIIFDFFLENKKTSQKTISEKTISEKTISEKTTPIPIKISDLPEVTVIKGSHAEEFTKVLNNSPIINQQEQNQIIEDIKCLDGEQYDTNEKRCLPCDKYDLVWDPEHKMCKPMLKDDIIKEQESKEPEQNFEEVKMLFDTKDNIIGYISDGLNNLRFPV